MKSVLPSAALCLFGLACGGPAPATLESFFPAANAVGAYAEDTSVGKAGVEIAKTAAAMEALIDGDAAPFTEKGAVAFGWEHYVSGTYKLDARVWQMKDAANATDTYAYLVANVSLYKANTWNDVGVGEAGRIADTGSSWWLDARKGKYLVEVKIIGKDTTSRADIEAFAKAMVAKMP